MPSPFPGMNPFLENPAVWPDFHLRMISMIGELLAPQLSPRYVVRAEAQLYIHELPARSRRLLGRGDVGISIATDRQATTATMAPIAPIRVRNRLPSISIPLRDRNENASLDLQVALHRVYDAARYEDDIYGFQPEPALSVANAKWARRFVPAAG